MIKLVRVQSLYTRAKTEIWNESTDHDCFTFSTVSKNVHACCAEQSETSRYKHLSSSWFHNQSWNQIWYSFLKMLLFVTKQLRICHMTHFEFLSLHQWKKTPKHLFSYWLLKYRDFSTSEQWDWNKSVQLNIKSVCGGKQGEQEYSTGLQECRETRRPCSKSFHRSITRQNSS